MPNLGSLAKSLVKMTIALAGDGASDASLVLLDTVVVAPNGDFTRSDQTFDIGKVLKGNVTEEQIAKYSLTNTSHAFLVSKLGWMNSGAGDPETYDSVLVDGALWRIEKIVEGSFGESFLIFACAAGVEPA